MMKFVLAVMIMAFTVMDATAGDKEDVIAARSAAIEAWNGTDVDKIRAHYADGFTLFQRDGSLLVPGGWNWETVREMYADGLKVTVGPVRHLDVKIYGNTALITGYGTVNVTLPGSEPTITTDRATSVWVKRDGVWKAVHQHASLLTPPQPD